MRFKRIYIEITNTCNLSCSFCIQNQRTPRRMSVEEVRHILQQIQPYTKFVYLHVLGEPLSHPQIREILAACEQYGMQVNITTNGTLLRKQREVLRQSRLRQLNVSLHSFPHHEQDDYLQDVFTVCEELAAQGVHISYRLWSLRDQQLTKESEVLLHQLLKHYQKPSLPQLQQRMRMDLGDHLHLNLETIFTWPSLQHPFVSTKGRCLGLKQMCAILSDGTVVPCCLDSKGDIPLGNLFQEDFAAILQKERTTRMLTDLHNQHMREALCQHCSYRLRFTKGRKEK